MADPTPSTFLQRTPSPAPEIARPGLTLRVERDIGIAKLQLLGEQPERQLSARTGLATPQTAAQVEENGLTLAWLAPGEWLLIGRESVVATKVSEMNAQSDADTLIVDLTHARTSFLVSGASARGALAAHCPLDLWPTAFPPGMVARSLLGDTGMFIACLNDGADDPCFRIIVDQTMASYAARMIAGPSPRLGAEL
jgi:sarcosine oxidase subunit gamma